MNVIYIVSIVLVGAGALAVAITRDLVRLTMVASLYTLLLVVFFLLLHAPDVALSELVVGTVAYPVVLLTAILLGRSED
jgi:energy-converting hydrogenase B subunit D